MISQPTPTHWARVVLLHPLLQTLLVKSMLDAVVAVAHSLLVLFDGVQTDDAFFEVGLFVIVVIQYFTSNYIFGTTRGGPIGWHGLGLNLILFFTMKK